MLYIQFLDFIIIHIDLAREHCVFLLKMSFSFDKFCEHLPVSVKELLISEELDTLPGLLGLTLEDIKSLPLTKLGHTVVLREAVANLKQMHGKEFGPASRRETSSPAPEIKISELLGALNINNGASSSTTQGTYLRIVDFVSSSLFSDEEVNLMEGVTLKVNSRIKLDKVSPAMWITANSRILQSYMQQSATFDTTGYLRYTEMVGELAARYTWQSVLLYDDEYRQRQAKFLFAWGTETPHLSTVMLRDRVTASLPTKKTGYTHRRQVNHATTPREPCRQFNRGMCMYGITCQFDHACTICGSREHGGKDHAQITATSPTSGTSHAHTTPTNGRGGGFA